MAVLLNRLFLLYYTVFDAVSRIAVLEVLGVRIRKLQVVIQS